MGKSVKKSVIIVISILLFVPAIVKGQTTVYHVKSGSDPSNTATGATSWANACGDLQAVVDCASSGDTVFVAVGVYRGGFVMREGVQVYGGFAGNEDYTTERVNKIDATNPANCSVLDGGDSERVLTQFTSFSVETVWDGFLIRNGSASAGIGTVVFSADGTSPAGIIYRWDVPSQSGYMVGVNQIGKLWGGRGTDITELRNISNNANALKDFSGAGNTALITKQLTPGNYAAYWCDTLTTGGFTDWYLPALGELNKIYEKKNTLNAVINIIKNNNPSLSDNWYLSSSEVGPTYAYFISFSGSSVIMGVKDITRDVRAVRAFNSFSNLNNLAFAGGGALLQANGVLRRSVVMDNKAGGMGGGIYINGGAGSATAQVQGCLVTGNTSGRGSGVYASGNGVVTNSTVADNKQDTTLITRPAPPQIGDYYYTNGRYSPSTSSAMPIDSLELAGIVCYINPSNPYSGYVLNAAQVNDKNWQEAQDWVQSLLTCGYSDWQQPHIDILRTFKNINRETLNDALSKISTTTITESSYWSGSEFNEGIAHGYNFNGEGSLLINAKYNVYNVCAVRAFNIVSSINNLENSGVVAQSSDSEVSNSIIWGNKEQDGIEADFYGAGKVSYSLAGTGVTDGNDNNTTANPDFVDVYSGDYRLKAASTAIKAGNPAVVPTGLTTDLDNSRRVASNKIDMGAYQTAKSDDVSLAYVRINGNDAAFDGLNSYTMTLPVGTIEAFFSVQANDSVYVQLLTVQNSTPAEVNNNVVGEPVINGGTYVFDIEVTAEDGISTGNYTLTATVALEAVQISTHPQSDNVCNRSSVQLSVTASGDIYDYTWYLDGTPISGANASTYDATKSGTYHVDVNGAVDTVRSNPAVITFSYSPVITTNLRNTTFSTTPATLRIEATGDNLTYQWYFGYGTGATAIAGATSDNITILESGYYHVKISNNCEAIISSNTVFVTFDLVIPVINRRITLPQVQGIITSPYAGSHYVRSREDFVFEMWPAAGYSLSNVTVTTDRGNEVSLSPTLSQGEGAGNTTTSFSQVEKALTTIPNGEGQGGASRLRVTVKHINAETIIRIAGVDPVGNERLGEHKFTAYPNPTNGPLTITGLTPGMVIRFYNIVGMQVSTLTAEAETITLDLSHLARGLYLLNADGRTIRVIRN